MRFVKSHADTPPFFCLFAYIRKDHFVMFSMGAFHVTMNTMVV